MSGTDQLDLFGATVAPRAPSPAVELPEVTPEEAARMDALGPCPFFSDELKDADGDD